MKRYINKILAIASVAISAMHISAQNTESAYFLDDYTYRYQMNPAIANSMNFVAMPMLGNLNMSISGTLSVRDIFYNVNGRTTTFMNPNISASEVMSNIKDKNIANVSMQIPILAAGFKAWGGYNTITFGFKANSNNKIPGSIFSLLKEGISNKTYNIGAIKENTLAYTEIGFGHSRKINDEIRVGATVKFNIGLANVDIDMKDSRLELGEDAWNIRTNGDINANIKGLEFKTKVNKTTGKTYVSDVDFDDYSPNGFGLGLDLGVVYTPKDLPDFEFSAALLDIGFINWSDTKLASTQGERIFTTDRYTFNVDKDAQNSFKNEWEIIKDDIASLYQLSDMGDQGSRTTGMGMTLNLGTKYTLPMYKALSFGLMNTTRIHGDYSWNDLRLSANWIGGKVFDASITGGIGTFGASFGWVANLHCKGFNLFAGTDCLISKMSKDGVPLSSNAAMNMGINFLF